MILFDRQGNGKVEQLRNSGEPPGLCSYPSSEGAPCKVFPSDPQGPGAALLHCQDASTWSGAKEETLIFRNYSPRTQAEGGPSALSREGGQGPGAEMCRSAGGSGGDGSCAGGEPWPHPGGVHRALAAFVTWRQNHFSAAWLLLRSPWTLTWKIAPSSNEPGFRAFGVATLVVAYLPATGPA